MFLVHHNLRKEMFDETLLFSEQVLKGWDIGIMSMKEGEMCRLTCQPSYAYGSCGMPPKIPENCTLIFEIELHAWNYEDLSEENDSSITRECIESGIGVEHPNDGAYVKVHIEGMVNGVIFDERVVEYNLFEEVNPNIPIGMDQALTHFLKKERSLITFQPRQAFGSKGNKQLGVPGNQALEYEVTLLEFEKVKQIYEMCPVEKMEQAIIHKDKGTQYFKAGKYSHAARQYEKVVRFVLHNAGLKENEKVENDAICLVGYLNLAATYLKLKEYTSACQAASDALKMDNDNVKALFRRASARQEMGDFQNAISDYEKLLEIEPNNSSAKRQILICRRGISTYKNSEKGIYYGMFDKFAQADHSKTQARKKATLLKGGVGEWDEEKEEEERKDELSDVKLLSGGSEIDGHLADMMKKKL